MSHDLFRIIYESLRQFQSPSFPTMYPDTFLSDDSFSNYDASSIYTCDSPSSVRIRSHSETLKTKPVRQYGPRLLPKIRSQDIQFDQSQNHGRLVPSTRNLPSKLIDVQSYNRLAHNSSQIPISSLHGGRSSGSGCFQSPLDTLSYYQQNSLRNYLTSPNPAPALVGERSSGTLETNVKHFWWDIRQIRPWNNFNMASIDAVPGFKRLLSLNLPATNLPNPPPTSLEPETESDLCDMHGKFYTTKLNAALTLTLGPRHLTMRQTEKGLLEPSFVSNYDDEFTETIYGRGLGRIVGIVKSFDNWNSGMRVEGEKRKVDYLRGLSLIHCHMRAYGCRYGFIMTEIELVVVRNGSDDIPNFGYLEVESIPLSNHGTQNSSFQDHSSPNVHWEYASFHERPRMTALMALWYLHMLARNDPIPGQPGWQIEIGNVADGTRNKFLPVDEWIPLPSLREMRKAKRSRGWIWPEEPVGNKELQNMSLRRL